MNGEEEAERDDPTARAESLASYLRGVAKAIHVDEYRFSQLPFMVDNYVENVRKRRDTRAEGRIAVLEGRATQLQIHRDQLSKALRYYADEDNWVERDDGTVECECDIGHVAREALTNDPAPNGCEWRRRDRVDGDPVWQAHMDGLGLQVSVPCGSPWSWDWCVIGDFQIELARGDLYVEHDDDAEDDWDYQGVETAQTRCEAVARALTPQGEMADNP